MAHDTAGVGMIGRILAEVASAEPCTATVLARRLGTARTTTFDVLRRLEAAGFIDRDPQGLVSPGLASADLGFAAFGMVGGAGATEALLCVLREEADASIELVIHQGEVTTVLAQRTVVGLADPDTGLRAPAPLDATVWTNADTKAILRVTSRASAQAADRAAVGRCVDMVAAALSLSVTPKEHQP